MLGIRIALRECQQCGATQTILLYIYDKAFRNSLGGDYGEATAVSVLLAIVLAVLSWLYFKLTNRWSTN